MSTEGSGMARIEDYAILGDTHCAALVSKCGSVDWLCLPRFDSDACFGALLGTEEHGCWRIQPVEALQKSERRYRPGTIVLETDLYTQSGCVRVVDCMPLGNKSPRLV